MNTLNVSNTLQQIMYNRWGLLLIQKPNLKELEKAVQNENRIIIKKTPESAAESSKLVYYF
jgi:hypothetical protein